MLETRQLAVDRGRSEGKPETGVKPAILRFAIIDVTNSNANAGQGNLIAASRQVDAESQAGREFQPFKIA
jgi:hypothetical protein